MKRALAYLFAAILLIGTSTAQDDRPIRFGLKFAPNMAWVTADGSDVKKSGNVVGYSFGLMADFQVGSPNYAFATGLFLNNIGGKFQHDYSLDSLQLTNKVEDDYRLRFIELPLTMKLKTNEIGYMTYYGQIGLGLALNIRSRGDIQEVDIRGDIKTETDEDIIDEINFLKTGLVLGAGFEYNFSGNTSAMVGVTYHGGFSQLNDDGNVDAGYNLDGTVKTIDSKLLVSYIELTVGVFF